MCGCVCSVLFLLLPPPTGSGSLAAMAVFEDRYKPDMEVTHRSKYLFSIIILIRIMKINSILK